jgi:hypothetical protein
MIKESHVTDYVQASSQTYKLVVDTLSAAARRRLNYWRSVWDVAAKPYNSLAPDGAVRESLDRTQRIVKLTSDELRARGLRTADFSNELALQWDKLGEAAVAMARDALERYTPPATAAATSVNGPASGVRVETAGAA